MRLVWLVMLGLTACSTGLSARDKAGTDFPTDAGEDTATTPDTGVTAGDNRAPVADAGDDRSGMVTDEIQLDGSSSFDPDGDTLDFLWEFAETPVGSAAFLINETRDDASFYADRPGTYIVELLIDDGQATDTDVVQVTVESPNEGPVANAGPDQNVDVGDRVALNGGASYDPDDDLLSFTWNLVSAPGGSGAVLDDPTSALPQFTADLAGTYVIELQVTDGVDVSPTDSVRVVAQNQDDSDCLSCATAESQLRRRYSVGDATSGAGLLLLPLLLLGIQRKRLMARED